MKRRNQPILKILLDALGGFVSLSMCGTSPHYLKLPEFTPMSGISLHPLGIWHYRPHNIALVIWPGKDMLIASSLLHCVEIPNTILFTHFRRRWSTGPGRRAMTDSLNC